MATAFVSQKKKSFKYVVGDNFGASLTGSTRAPSVLNRNRSFAKPGINYKISDTWTDEGHAASAIQRTYRGHLLRERFRGLINENAITYQSLMDALETVAVWHLGWNRFFTHCLVVACLIVTVYVQIYQFTPTAFDVDSALITRLDDIGASSLVTDPVTFFDFLLATIDTFYQEEMVDSDYCNQTLETYCNSDSSSDDAVFESILGSNCSVISELDEESDLDYIDQSNRLLGATFVSQTRKEARNCSAKVLAIDTFLQKKDRVVRVCLDEDVEETNFILDSCPGAPTPLIFGPTSCLTNNTDEEFVYQTSPAATGFIFPIHAGKVYALPYKALNCKIERMKRLGWLDYRSKNVCLLVALFNKQDQGRLILYQECFHFMNGGRVDNQRSVSSTSLYADPSTAVMMTWFLVVVILVKQCFDTFSFLHGRLELCRRRRRAQKLRIMETFISSTPNLLILVGSAVFLAIVDVVGNVNPGTSATGTLNDFTDTLVQTNLAVQLWVAYTTIISIALIMMLFKSLSLLDFHPTSAVVSGTLKKASNSLLCFFAIFALVVLNYALVGMILLGRSRYEFSTFGLAINTLLFAALGELQQLETLVFYTRVDAEYVTVIQALYFWSYILLVTILLMNVLLSIIVGAFVNLQDKTEKSLDSRPILSLQRSLFTSVRIWLDGVSVIVRRFCNLFGSSSSCSCSQKKRRRVDSSEIEIPPLILQTSWEKLVNFPKQYLQQPADHSVESTGKTRDSLQDIFNNTKTVELIILWCRGHSRMGKLLKFGIHLRGLDPDSEALKGHTVYLLESIMRRMGESSHNNRSVGGGGATISSTASGSTRVLMIGPMIERTEVVESEGEDGDNFERGKQLLHNRRLLPHEPNRVDLNVNHHTEEQVVHSVVKKNLAVVTNQQMLAENDLINMV